MFSICHTRVSITVVQPNRNTPDSENDVGIGMVQRNGDDVDKHTITDDMGILGGAPDTV